jgi:hypothetical protein
MIKLNISNISKLIGRLNRDLVKTFEEEVLKKINKREYKVYINNIKEKIVLNEQKEQTPEIIKQNDEHYKNILSKDQYLGIKIGIENLKIINDKETNIKDKKEKIKEVIKEDEILDIANSVINTKNGIFKEDLSIKLFEKEYNIGVIRKQEYTIKHIKDNYYIHGKIDGILETDLCLLEAKNRQSNFFKNIRDYENVQIQLYLYSLDIENGKLVECYDNKINVIEFKRDNEYIRKLIKSLEFLVDKITEFINNEQLKNEYMNLNTEEEKIKFLNKFYLNELKTKKINNKYF